MSETVKPGIVVAELGKRAEAAHAEARRRISYGMNGAGPESARRAYEDAADLLRAALEAPEEEEHQDYERVLRSVLFDDGEWLANCSDNAAVVKWLRGAVQSVLQVNPPDIYTFGEVERRFKDEGVLQLALEAANIGAADLGNIISVLLESLLSRSFGTATGTTCENCDRPELVGAYGWESDSGEKRCPDCFVLADCSVPPEEGGEGADEGDWAIYRCKVCGEQMDEYNDGYLGCACKGWGDEEDGDVGIFDEARHELVKVVRAPDCSIPPGGEERVAIGGVTDAALADNAHSIGGDWPEELTIGRETLGGRTTEMFVIPPGEVVERSAQEFIQTRRYIPADASGEA